MALYRTHVMLEPEQHKALKEIARREGRSVSEVTREIVQQGIIQRQQQYESEVQKRLNAFENARRVREEMYQEYGDQLYDIDLVTLINEMREER